VLPASTGIGRKKPKGEPAKGTESPEVPGSARSCPVHTMLGGFFLLIIAIGMQFIGGWLRHCDFRSSL
jgi:hypothetical protein